MMGIPGETRDDILKTLDFAHRIKPDFLSFSVYEIFPGTELHKLGVMENSAVNHMEIEDYFNIQPQNYFFLGHRRHLKGMSMETFNSLEKHMKQKFQSYNRSPRSIYRRAKSRLPLYKKKPTYLIGDIKSFIRWI
jgi:radical SAM superfamily enzyme YgiQ (UPF0313 family)